MCHFSHNAALTETLCVARSVIILRVERRARGKMETSLPPTPVPPSREVSPEAYGGIAVEHTHSRTVRG